MVQYDLGSFGVETFDISLNVSDIIMSHEFGTRLSSAKAKKNNSYSVITIIIL